MTNVFATISTPVLILQAIAALIAIIYGIHWVSKDESPLRSILKTLPVLLLSISILFVGANPVLFLALFCCAAGDFFLSKEGEQNFLLGLGAFLVGHIFYSINFLQLINFSIPFTQDILFIGLILLGLAAFVLIRTWPALGSLKLPVIIYMMVIGIMAITAKAAEPGQIILAGIALFVISDTILALEKFTPLTNSFFRQAMPWLVWIFYYCGQALIALGHS